MRKNATEIGHAAPVATVIGLELHASKETRWTSGYAPGMTAAGFTWVTAEFSRGNCANLSINFDTWTEKDGKESRHDEERFELHIADEMIESLADVLSAIAAEAKRRKIAATLEEEFERDPENRKAS